MVTRRNNFDFLRLIFASFVIITHSYPLTGLKECDWLCQITNGQISFSEIGVKGFFIISGFLIFQSLERSKNLGDYFWKRFLRLFPGLFVVLLLTVLLAPFVYENNAIPYLHNKTAWTYLPNNLFLYHLQYNITGVFEHNPYKSAINGSLWTIPYEFTMYVFLSFLFMFRNKKAILKTILLNVFLLLFVLNVFFLDQVGKYQFILSANHFLDLGLFFAAGSLLAVLKIEQFMWRNTLLFFSIILLVIALVFGFWGYTKFAFLPIAVILIGVKSTSYLDNIGNKIGDLSYGIYVYGFPVQQTLEYYFKLNYLQLSFASLAVSFFLAYLSWHLIESKALKLKNYAQNRLTKNHV